MKPDDLRVFLEEMLPDMRWQKAVVIKHVKWRRQSQDPYYYPAADTDQFSKLPALNRGTLIFIPADEDYGAQRDDIEDKL